MYGAGVWVAGSWVLNAGTCVLLICALAMVAHARCAFAFATPCLQVELAEKKTVLAGKLCWIDWVRDFPFVYVAD